MREMPSWPKAALVRLGEACLILALLTLATFAFNALNQIAISGVPFWLSTIGFWALMLAPTAFLPRKARMLAYLTISGLAALVLLSNQLYYRYYQEFLTIPSLLLTSQVFGIRNSLLPLARVSDLVYVLPATIAMGLALWAVWKARGTRPTKRVSLVTALLVGGAGAGLFGTGYRELSTQGADDIPWDGNMPFVQQVGLFTYHVYDAQRYWTKVFAKPPLSDERLNAIRSTLMQQDRLPNALTGLGEGKNLIVIQLETFEGFPLGLKVGGQALTPNLNRLSAESLYFPNMYFQVARGNTSDAEFMLNNSLLPLRQASVNWNYAKNDYHSLPKMLKEKGYQSVAFHPYKRRFWNRALMYPQLGFEAFYSEEYFRPDEQVNLGLSDGSLYRQSLELLERHAEPFFAQYITLSTHHPYQIPEAYRAISLPDWIPGEMRDYLHAVHYADQAVGEFVTALEKRGLLERSVLVIYGDHTGISPEYALPIHRLLGHDAPGDEAFAAASLQRVPMLIRVPGAAVRGTREQVVGQIDILPTLTNLMGLGGSHVMMGQDLLETSRKPTPLSGRYPTGSFVDDAVIYLAAPDGRFEDGRLYDRRTGARLATERAAGKHQEVMAMHLLAREVIEHDLIGALREYALAQQQPAVPQP